MQFEAVNTYKGYKDLNCYQKARELRMFVAEISRKFPSSEKFILIDQIKRSSRAITANIAEGYGRFTYTDTRNFFIIARGSVTETMEHLQTAFDEKYITNDELEQSNSLCETVFQLINGYISYLDKSRSHKP